MLLETIDSPSDLRKLKEDQLPDLCTELRNYIIDCCSKNPGHLASSLGAVELIVALHYVYNTPVDKLIFDVGHQAYAHKILSGRREAFATMRTKGGISGFPSIFESEYDAFGVGHSSTSISAALGYAQAAKIKGSSEKVVATIGDGALTGGLAFEGLNNAGASKTDLLIILNDNNQSIDSNLGALHNHLLKISTSDSYNNFKNKIWDLIGERGFRSVIQRWWRSLKSWLVKKSGGDIFESLGFRYFGPVDGHDVIELVHILQKLKSFKGPRILHCMTVKGKGYAPAEQDPGVWHAPGKFDPATGERVKVQRDADRYQDVFGEVLCELGSKDKRVVGITPAMVVDEGGAVVETSLDQRQMGSRVQLRYGGGILAVQSDQIKFLLHVADHPETLGGGGAEDHDGFQIRQGLFAEFLLSAGQKAERQPLHGTAGTQSCEVLELRGVQIGADDGVHAPGDRVVLAAVNDEGTDHGAEDVEDRTKKRNLELDGVEPLVLTPEHNRIRAPFE